jgi:hypothetical protein
MFQGVQGATASREERIDYLSFYAWRASFCNFCKSGTAIKKKRHPYSINELSGILESIGNKHPCDINELVMFGFLLFIEALSAALL